MCSMSDNCIEICNHRQDMINQIEQSYHSYFLASGNASATVVRNAFSAVRTYAGENYSHRPYVQVRSWIMY